MLEVILLFLCPFFFIIGISYLVNRNRYFAKYGIKTYPLQKYLTGSPIHITSFLQKVKKQEVKFSIDADESVNKKLSNKQVVYQDYVALEGVTVQSAMIKVPITTLYPSPLFETGTNLLKLQHSAKIKFDIIDNGFARTKVRTIDNEIKCAWVSVKDLSITS